ncbi:hypothetical protein C7T36_14665 [Rhodococcus sp. AD45-ID]|uniref:hypothetical protein n=1 Tax=unclassified Rhodococcus (in: high G+C Gram-positive bacteria) TaxID=192944 RepID=UPI0005D336E4|nr:MULTISPECIES: hypothetical protein [unclassified Rhodococcus (in: high G+C Gram-positive bacteria)]KJF25082.1 hypothetical protein SZ00_02008 [Rhodococcus sp. AD45]PSR43287.1 hypothetical protein C7T36_14665 [Rhodococcus sp. AD45-ID]
MAKDIIIEVTDRIERMDALEERLGVSLEAMYAVYTKTSYSSGVRVNFDVIAPSGQIDSSLKVVISAYNQNGQLVATDYTRISESSFIGFESCSESLDCDGPPSKIRVYPTNS